MSFSVCRMLGSFLMESTIHGLRYLVLTRAAFYRLLWLVAILCSISLAFTLVYFNVLNFKRSPTVVTTVDEYGVKVCCKSFLNNDKAKIKLSLKNLKRSNYQGGPPSQS